ncbi:uncharacterized protein BX663DRAFT_490521 [Cokeromyces recurvatus]|uniref:uncharacterized protein n=1 Tax=Cokeromyces recurvatus TaxID=90255 RepID=UPI002221235E|nr:uncharacterized protein BX663DRAFT_490521 [Cokeromyces recurvatus]KAI7897903.1 hypothetical protein BX663DRAFT_490521 [Cokeromyces recurvatus]
MPNLDIFIVLINDIKELIEIYHFKSTILIYARKKLRDILFKFEFTKYKPMNVHEKDVYECFEVNAKVFIISQNTYITAYKVIFYTTLNLLSSHMINPINNSIIRTVSTELLKEKLPMPSNTKLTKEVLLFKVEIPLNTSEISDLKLQNLRIYALYNTY